MPAPGATENVIGVDLIESASCPKTARLKTEMF